jgi:hypothetical protein
MYRRAARYNKKRQPTANKPPYAIRNPHSKSPLVPAKHINVVAIDPGIKNCAIRVASMDLKTRAITTQLQMVFDFTHSSLTADSKGIGLDTAHYTNIPKVLDKYVDFFRWSHYIVIESQLPINYDLTRMSSELMMYFTLRVRDEGYRPLIIEIDPHLKSRMLDAPPKMSKPQLKTWARNKAIEILKERGDNETAQMIMEVTKGDDHGDTVCYEAVWWLILQGHLHVPPLPDMTGQDVHIEDSKAEDNKLPLPKKSRLDVDEPTSTKPRSRLDVDDVSQNNTVCCNKSRLQLED